MEIGRPIGWKAMVSYTIRPANSLTKDIGVKINFKDMEFYTIRLPRSQKLS